MKLKKLSVGLMTAVLTAGLLASPAMASEVTDAAAVQNGTVTVQAAATENGAAGTGTSDDIQGEIKDTGKDDAENGTDQGEGKEDTGKDDGKGNTGKDDTGKDDGKEDEAFTGLKEIDGIWWYLTEGDVDESGRERIRLVVCRKRTGKL